jgi:putative addiction module component (TIGR02574 family)
MPRQHTPSPDPERLAEAALKLKPRARARLAHRLLASLPADPEVDEAWDREALRRLEEIRTGAVKALPTELVLKRAFALPRRKR